jgi:beta-lactamase regulating signal transducer with metallopeptidase domain
MISPLAFWMPYAAALMASAAVLALLVERYARGLRLPTRYIWITMLLVSPCLALLANREPSVSVTPNVVATGLLPAVGTALSRRLNDASRVDARSVVAWAEGAQRVEHLLERAWVATSGLALVLLACVAFSLRRRTGDAHTSTIDGITVRIDERLGPAASPFHGGAIIVPPWLQTLDTPLRRLVLTHEAEHLRAADPALLLLATLAVALLPWSPAAWWMLRRLRLAVEVDCDSRTLASCGAVNESARKQYARLLILAAQQSAVVRRPPGASIVLPAISSHLARRLHMLTQPVTQVTRSRVVALTMSIIGITTLAVAMPRPPRVATVGDQPAEIVGLYLMETPDVPSSVMLAPGREFTYLRLSADGRSRMENVTVDARGEQVAPSVEVGPWSTDKWQVQPATGGSAAKLCWQLGVKLVCSTYARNAASGDITLYRGAVGSAVELRLRRASNR